MTLCSTPPGVSRIIWMAPIQFQNCFKDDVNENEEEMYSRTHSNIFQHFHTKNGRKNKQNVSKVMMLWRDWEWKKSFSDIRKSRERCMENNVQFLWCIIIWRWLVNWMLFVLLKQIYSFPLFLVTKLTLLSHNNGRNL